MDKEPSTESHPILTFKEIINRNKEKNRKINSGFYGGQVYDKDGNQIYEPSQAIYAYGLINLTENQWGHGAVSISNLEEGYPFVKNLYEALTKKTIFTGDFGPIAGTANAENNPYQTTWEGGHYIITRNDENFCNKDGTLNTNGIEVILNGTMVVFGQDFADTFPEITFKDYTGKIIEPKKNVATKPH